VSISLSRETLVVGVTYSIVCTNEKKFKATSPNMKHFFCLYIESQAKQPPEILFLNSLPEV
jgi:hypothetical protein